MSAGTEESKPRGRARYYTPRPIHLAPGVVQDDGYKDSPCDYFIGTMEALVASGLADAPMFPGQPGVGLTRAAYNPTDAERRLAPNYSGKMEPVSLWRVPGRIVIARKLDGLFTIQRTVSYEEQDAREHARKAREEANMEQHKQEPSVPPDSGALTRTEREKAGRMFLDYSISAIGLEGVAALLDAMGGRAGGTKALASMGMLHRRKLPDGWRVIEGQRQA